MTLPLVSIIIPTYNRAHLIVETLESVAQQSYLPIELLIVDDGSSDTTAIIVHEWTHKNKSRFQKTVYHQFEKNFGKSAAVNYGFEIFTGEFLMILDSDDILLPTAIEEEIDYLLKNPIVDAVCAGAFILDGSIKTQKALHCFQEIQSFLDINSYYGDLLLKGNALIASTVILKRKIIQTIGGFNTKLRYTHDWEYWLRVARQFQIGYINIPVVYYRTNVSGASSLKKYGTFVETRYLLMESRSRYTRGAIFSALRYQIYAHLWLSYKDGNIIDMAKIFFYGYAGLIKFALVGK